LNSKQKGSGYGKNGLNLREIDSNPGKNSWKIKGSKKIISLSSQSNSKEKNSNLRRNSFYLKEKKRTEREVKHKRFLKEREGRRKIN
jgi:hypothetical protein